MNYQERLFRQRHGYGCEPATIAAVASLAISAAGTAASVQGQKNAADAQLEQQRGLTAANGVVLNEQLAASREQATQLRMQEAQQQESIARENEKARLASQRGRATAIVSAGEAGVSGSSVDALLSEYGAQLGQFREATNRQQQLNSQATNAQVATVQTGARGQAMGARFQNLQINAPVVGPNYGAAIAQFGASALGTYKDYRPSAFQSKPKIKTT
jgi:hypothetical protein